mgnify:CR=1 FL=1
MIGDVPDLAQVRSCGVCFYVLRDGDGLYLIDTGFIGAASRLEKVLASRGWETLPIRGILLTHGHLDHVLNAARFARRNGAWIAGPEGDRERFAGRHQPHGAKRLVDRMEGAGRRLLDYEPFCVDRLVRDDETFDLWHGLRAIHLPGHTEGHTGYLCEKFGLLFCGDLFASYGPFSHRPPRCFNEDSPEAERSIRRALGVDLHGVLPHHCDHAPAAKHLQRLRRLAG